MSSQQPSLSWWTRWSERIPLTWQGCFLLLLSGAVMWFMGIGLEDWILLVLGLFGVLLVVLSFVGVGLSALYIRWRLRVLNENNESRAILTDTAHPVESGFFFPRFVPPFIDFTSCWESPNSEAVPVVRAPHLTEEVRFYKRGQYDSIVRLFEVRDLFGLAHVRWRTKEQRDIEVWPQMHAHPAPLIRSFSDGDDMYVPNRPKQGDRVDIRAYMPGDSIRLIHWKLFARSQEAYVRVPESAASFERQIIAFLVSDEDDALAARIARHDMEHGHLGSQWLFGADFGDEVASDAHSGRRLLALSGKRPARHGMDLASFLQSVDFKPDQHRLMLYVSGGTQRWLSNIEPTLRKYCAVTTLIVANQLPTEQDAPKEHSVTQHSVSTTRWTPILRWFLRPSASMSDTASTSPVTLQQLIQEGLQVHMVQPTEGERPLPKPERPHPSVQGRRRRGSTSSRTQLH